jgi:Mg-chelatase subunit ChlI
MATETSSAVTEFIEGLNALRSEYQQLENGYNESLYDVLQQAAASIETLQKKPKFAKKVLKEISKRKNRDLALTVVTFITGAKTKEAKKRASKFARALTYLTNVKNVAADDIAKVLKDAGGIEKLARAAAKETPKTKRAHAKKSMLSEESDDEAAPEVGVENSAKAQLQKSNRVNLKVTTAFTKKLSKARVGRKVILTCRVDDLDDGIDLTITKVVLIKEVGKETW